MQVQKAFNSCMVACNAIEIQKQRKRQMLTTIKPHIQSLQSIGAMDVAFSYIKKDVQGMLENYCKMMEHPDAKKIINAMLTDIVKLYKGMDKEMSEMVDCFLAKCDKTAIELLMLIMRAYLSTHAVLADKTLSKRLNEIQDVVLSQMKRSYERLQKNTSKPLPNSAINSSSKSRRVTKKSH